MVNLKKQFGFSLVELSVVLAVIGVTLGGALTIATKKTEADKVNETMANMDKIEQAMQVYLVEKRRLPCTFNIVYDINTADFGISGTPNVSGDNGGCTTTYNYNSGSIYSGGVPTRALKIPDSYAFDGWGRRIFLIVDTRFSNNEVTNALCDGGSATSHKVCFKYQSAGGITVKDSNGNNRTTQAIYVLLSSGKNGNGGISNTGGTLACPTDADEIENARNCEGAFDTTLVQKDATTTFDDIVRYKTKTQMMYDANLIDDYDFCITTVDKVANCTGASNATYCQNLADQIATWCLDM